VSVQLDRAIDILELIHSSERPLALGEVADRIRIPKSAAHRILQDWSTRGYVEQEPGGQRYAPTLKLAIIGFRHLVASGLRDMYAIPNYVCWLMKPASWRALLSSTKRR
jgi:IclR family transcriptional regulator, acetate operon repressor